MGKFLEGLAEDLILYVRFVAWLNTAPQVDSRAEKQTRLEKLRADRKEPEYHPELPDMPVSHWVSYLWDVGPSLPTGNGPAPITYGELVAWQQTSGVTLSPWDAQMVRRLSIEYINEQSRAVKPGCPSPLAKLITDADRVKVADGIKNAFRMLMG